MREERLKHVADIRVSNVDKKTVEGEVPIRLCNYTDVYYHDRITGALDFMEATATRDQRNIFGLGREDVILTKDSETADDIGASALVAEDVPNLVCGYHLALVRARTGRALGGYLHWVLASVFAREQMSAAATGVTRFGLRAGEIADLRVPVLPIAVQQSIADYLDRETARIDDLIAAKRRMVQLLGERDQAEISHLVVPDTCELAHLRHFATIQGGITVDSGRDPGPNAVTRPYLRVANVQAGHLDLTEMTEITVPLALAVRSTLRRGDVLMTEGGDIDKLGRGTVWSGELDGCLHQNHIFAVRPDVRHLDSWYLALVTQSSHARSYFESTGVQSTNLASTNSSKILDLPIPILPQHVQREIVAKWKTSSHWTTDMQSALRQQMTLLVERRAALITAAVTGQLDIAEAA